MSTIDKFKAMSQAKFQKDLDAPTVCVNGLSVQLSFPMEKDSETYQIKHGIVNQIVFQYATLSPLKALDLAKEIHEYAMYCIEEYEKDPCYCICFNGEKLREDDGSLIYFTTLSEAIESCESTKKCCPGYDWVVRPLSYAEYFEEIE